MIPGMSMYNSTVQASTGIARKFSPLLGTWLLRIPKLPHVDHQLPVVTSQHQMARQMFVAALLLHSLYTS